VYLHENLLVTLVARPGRGSAERPYALAVLTSDGNGNIGDQAMVEAACEAVHGRVLLVAESPASVPARSIPDNADVALIPGFVSSWRPGRIARTRDMIHAIDSAEKFAVIGADVMDGVYSPLDSVMRSTYMRVAADRGVPTRVLGFSWSANATPSAKHALRRASGSVSILPRDPRSESRLKLDGISCEPHTADTVFTSLSTAPVSFPLDHTRKLAIVNASGLISRSSGGGFIDEYGLILAELARLDYRVVLLPHVIRNTDSDLDALRSIADANRGGAFLIEDRVSPAQVRWLATKADLIITGRMHLAVMGLNMACPSITLSTVGKVEGLYDMFELSRLVVPPQPGYGALIAEMIAGLDLDDVRAEIVSHLPRVRALARSNFHGLSSIPTSCN
jgi:polysaccharide pyruvyl transferase WcaK-like protein